MSEMEDDFELWVSKHLERVDAPAFLADEVIRRTIEEPRSIVLFAGHPVQWHLLAALFILTALLGGVGVKSIYHHRAVEQARAERDFAKSLDLTSRALEPVRQRLQQAGIVLDQ